MTTRGLVIVALLVGLTTTGCGTSGEPRAEEAASVREVASATGKTVRIPARPERLVVDWITFDNLIALDVDLTKVAGAFGLEYFKKDPSLSPVMVGKATEAGVDAIGEAFEPKYEVVAALKPDAILLAKDQSTEEVVAKLETIAPVVVYAVPDGRRSFDDWRSSLRATAGVLDLGHTANDYVGAYDAKVADFRAKHPEVVDGVHATVGKVTNDKVTVSMYKRNLGTNVVDELGLIRPAAQRSQKVDAYQSFEVSLERLDLLDADIIFLEQRQVDTRFLTGNKLWKRLKAVRNNRVFFVKNYWQSGGAGSAKQVLDDAIAALTRK